MQLYNFLNENNVLVDEQFSFRKGLSCELALLNAKEFILNGLKENCLLRGFTDRFKKSI